MAPVQDLRVHRRSSSLPPSIPFPFHDQGLNSGQEPDDSPPKRASRKISLSRMMIRRLTTSLSRKHIQSDSRGSPSPPSVPPVPSFAFPPHSTSPMPPTALNLINNTSPTASPLGIPPPSPKSPGLVLPLLPLSVPSEPSSPSAFITSFGLLTPTSLGGHNSTGGFELVAPDRAKPLEVCSIPIPPSPTSPSATSIGSSSEFDSSPKKKGSNSTSAAQLSPFTDLKFHTSHPHLPSSIPTIVVESSPNLIDSPISFEEDLALTHDTKTSLSKPSSPRHPNVFYLYDSSDSDSDSDLETDSHLIRGRLPARGIPHQKRKPVRGHENMDDLRVAYCAAWPRPRPAVTRLGGKPVISKSASTGNSKTTANTRDEVDVHPPPTSPSNPRKEKVSLMQAGKRMSIIGFWRKSPTLGKSRSRSETEEEDLSKSKVTRSPSKSGINSIPLKTVPAALSPLDEEADIAALNTTFSSSRTSPSLNHNHKNLRIQLPLSTSDVITTRSRSSFNHNPSPNSPAFPTTPISATELPSPHHSSSPRRSTPSSPAERSAERSNSAGPPRSRGRSPGSKVGPTDEPLRTAPLLDAKRFRSKEEAAESNRLSEMIYSF